MKSNAEIVFRSDPRVFLLKDLRVRPFTNEEQSRAGDLLDQEHYLGDCPEGRQLLQVIEYKGDWVGGPACWKLSDRETHIG